MKRPKHKQNFKETTIPLPANHTWKAPEGYKIVVLERGLVSFNVPDTWIVAKLEPFELHDGAPPNDNARLTTSFWRLPVGVDWSGLPLDKMLIDSTNDSKMKVLAKSELFRVNRPGVEIVWVEHRFEDTENDNREAFTRILVARGWNVQILITFDFWVDEAPKYEATWEEVVRSLILGRYIQDPTKPPLDH